MRILCGVVGIDYHLKSLQVTLLDSDGLCGGRKRLCNDTEAVARYVRERCEKVRLVALEASTGSNEFAWELKSLTGWEVRLCHPGYVRRMRHNPEKSDMQDADLIADLARVGYLPQVWLAPVDVRERRAVVRYREALIHERTGLKLKIKALLREHRIALSGQWGCKSLWTKRGLRWLEQLSLGCESSWILHTYVAQLDAYQERMKTVDKRIEQLFETDVLAQELTKEVGVGIFSSVVLSAEVGTFRRFRRGKEFARFCGLTPRNASSGERQADAGLVAAGNKLLRRIVIQIAHTRVLYREPTSSVLFARLRAAGKPYNVAIAAVGNRWLRELCGRMRKFEEQSNALA